MKADFPTIIAALIVISAAICLFDRLVLAPRRRMPSGSLPRPVMTPAVPKIVEYARSLLPVFLIVFVFRSFIIEPFRIPSNSMMPTLLTGDFILVNKFSYGIRMPLIDKKIIDLGAPQRGDVVVFRYPDDETTPFIKRVVGLPGDRIGYFNKVLYVNGEPMIQTDLGTYVGLGSGSGMTGANWRNEQLDQMLHQILVQTGIPTLSGEVLIPEGHYFVLGDNRDNSRDSRYWGTVADELLIGKAFRIWMHWDWGHGHQWNRIGNAIR